MIICVLDKAFYVGIAMLGEIVSEVMPTDELKEFYFIYLLYTS